MRYKTGVIKPVSINNVGTYAVPQLPQFFGNTLSALEPLVFVNMNLGDCSLDGVYVSCTMAFRAAASGAATVSHIDPYVRQQLSSQGVGLPGRYIEIPEPDTGFATLGGTHNSSVTVYGGGTTLLFVPEIAFSWDVSTEPQGPPSPPPEVSQ